MQGMCTNRSVSNQNPGEKGQSLWWGYASPAPSGLGSFDFDGVPWKSSGGPVPKAGFRNVLLFVSFVGAFCWFWWAQGLAGIFTSFRKSLPNKCVKLWSASVIQLWKEFLYVFKNCWYLANGVSTLGVLSCQVAILTKLFTGLQWSLTWGPFRKDRICFRRFDIATV